MADSYLPPAGNGPLVKLSLPGEGPEEFYIVEGIIVLMGLSILRNMLIVKNANGDLTLVNSVRLDAATETEMLKLGKPTKLIRVSNHHGVDDFYYFDKFKVDRGVS